jgi:hypothetical protein
MKVLCKCSECSNLELQYKSKRKVLCKKCRSEKYTTIK